MSSLIKRKQWSIGIYKGESPFALQPIAKNPVLTAADVTDIPAEFVADPFMIQDQTGTWYMFFEVLHARRGKGEIAVAKSEDGLTWTYQQVVLSEEFHLSYPYLFHWQGRYYLIPETNQAQEIRLYVAEEFPVRWKFHSTLLRGAPYVDSSLFFYDGLCWLFTQTEGDLHLFYADDIEGPWQPHAQNPVIKNDPHLGRPGGRVLVHEGRPIRFAQDQIPFYGSRIWAIAVEELTKDTYRERVVSEEPFLEPSGTGWNAERMHHIDIHNRQDDQTFLACADGLTEVVDARPGMIANRVFRAVRNRF